MSGGTTGEVERPAFGRRAAMEVGIVLRRQPGATRWAEEVWRAVGVLPGAPAAEWRELRREGDTVDYHAATLTLEIFRDDTEGYLLALDSHPPALFVVMRETEEPEAEFPLEVVLVTASPFEAQDYLDSGEDIVERVPMPPVIQAWIADFIACHHRERPFRKRRRREIDLDQVEDGRGDPRVNPDDVFLSPAGRRGANRNRKKNGGGKR